MEDDTMASHTAELEFQSRPLERRLDDDEYRPARQAYGLLRVAFILAPIIAGVDKFTQLLVDWTQYLAPVVSGMSPVAPHTLMQGIGVVEIIAGLLVAARPAIGGYVVAAWLWGIIVNLLLIPGHYDIALRDFGLSLGGRARARLASAFSRD
jgi:hypothetical protein